MDGSILVGMVSALAACGAVGVGVLQWLESRKQRLARQTEVYKPPNSSAPPVWIPALLAASVENPATAGRIIIRGAAPDHTTPRELDVKLQGDVVHFDMHPPGKSGIKEIALKLSDMRQSLASGSYMFPQTGTKRRLVVKFPSDDPGKIPPGEVRIELGTPSSEWWLYAPEDEVRRALGDAGIAFNR